MCSLDGWALLSQSIHMVKVNITYCLPEQDCVSPQLFGFIDVVRNISPIHKVKGTEGLSVSSGTWLNFLRFLFPNLIGIHYQELRWIIYQMTPLLGSPSAFEKVKYWKPPYWKKIGELPILGLVSISAQTLTLCRSLRLDSEHHVHAGAGRDLAWVVLSEQGGRGHARGRVFNQISFTVGVRRETVDLKMDSPQIPCPASPWKVYM